MAEYPSSKEVNLVNYSRMPNRLKVTYSAPKFRI